MFTSITKIYSKIKTNRLKVEYIIICIIYCLVGLLWIYLSDIILNKLVKTNSVFILFSTYKGWVYVIITTMLLYILIGNLVRKVELADKQFMNKYEELKMVNEKLKDYVQRLTTYEEDLKAQYDTIIETETMLRKSEEKNIAIISALPDLLFIINEEGKFIDCMANDESVLLMPKEVFIGKNISEIMSKDISKTFLKKIQCVLKTGKMESFEYYLDIMNYSQNLEVRIVKKNEREVLGIARNVTSEKQNEEVIKAGEYSFRNIFENASDGIFLIKDNQVINCNEAMVELLGCTSKEQILGKKMDEFSPEKQPDGENSDEKAFEMYRRTLENGKYMFEWWYRAIDGKVLPVEVMMTTILQNGEEVFHSLWREISERKQMEKNLNI